MQEYERELEKYIFTCLDSIRGVYRVEDSIELLLALHMLREVASRDRIENIYDELIKHPIDETQSRFNELQHSLTQHEGPEYLALGSKLEHLNNDSNSLYRVLQSSRHINWNYRDAESEFSPNQIVINKLLVELLEKQGKKGYLGVLSDYVCEIVSNILEGYNVNEVYDPCAGSSKLALFAARNLNPTTGVRNSKKVVVNEINSSAIFLTFARFLGSNITEYDMRQKDSLYEEMFSSKRHEASVFFPPIKMDASKYEGLYPNFPFFMKRDAAPLFILTALEAIENEGVAIAVLPESFLIGQNKIAQYRSHLVHDKIIRCAIKLPQNSLSNAGISLSLVVFDKRRRNNQVRLIDASQFSTQSNSREGSRLPPEDIAALALGADSKYNEDICTDVSFPKLINNDSILSFNYYKQFTLRHELDVFTSGVKNAKLQTYTLEDICDIEFGRHIPRDMISDQQLEHSVPFLRIGDIKSVDKIYSKSSVEFDAFKHLLPILAVENSIVFSIQGTVGKVALVPKGKEYFPSSGITVLNVTCKLVLPEYLVAYLTSKPIRQWLETVSSTSTTIRRIDKKQLKRLPILVPSVAWQRLVAQEFSENKTDVFDSLKLLSNDFSNNVFIYPLQKISKIISGAFSRRERTIQEYLEFFSQISSFSENLETFEFAKYSDYEMTQVSLINDLKDSLKVLNNLRFVPDGNQQSAILDIAFEKLSKLQSKLEDTLYFSSLITEICVGIQSSINKFMEIQNSEGSLLIELAPNHETEQGKIIATVKNLFRFPIINVQIKSDSLKESKVISFIGDGAQEIIKLDIIEEYRAVVLNWQAHSLNNTTLSGQVELAGFDTIDQDNSIEWKASPYITGDPVKPNQQMALYGRDDILKSISRYIAEAGNVVLLEGNRRVGKSSILYHLQSNTFIPGWICVYMSLQECEGCDKSGIPAWSIWRVMTSQIILALVKSGMEVRLPDGEMVSQASGRFYQSKVKTAVKKLVSIESPFFDFQSYLEELLEVLQTQKTGIVIMIDEFDKLQEGIDNGVTTPQVPENIRSIIHRYDNLSAILTGSRRLQRLREEYWSALFGLGTRIGVSELDLVNSRKLITEPSAGQLKFTEEAVDQIVDQTGKHPFLIQCLCNKLYDSAAKANVRQIDTKFVSQAISDFIKDNEHFMYFWNLAGVVPGDSRCQLILFIFAREEQSGNRLSSGELLESLIENGVDLPEKLFEQFINYLLELELIERRGVMGEQVYSLTTPLLSKWLLESQDYERVLAGARQEFEKD
jgi:type I restriction enzyme M protein